MKATPLAALALTLLAAPAAAQPNTIILPGGITVGPAQQSGRGVWARRFQVQPTGPTGSVELENQSRFPIEVTFDSPHRGVRRATLRPRETRSHQGIEIGANVRVNGRRGWESFTVSGVLKVTVRPDRTVTAISAAPGPGPGPGPGPRPGFRPTGGIRITSSAATPTLARITWQVRGPNRTEEIAISPGGEWIENDATAGTVVRVNGQRFEVEADTMLSLRIRRSGDVRARRTPINGPTPPPVVGATTSLFVTNNHASSISVTVRSRHGGIGNQYRVAPGQTVRRYQERAGSRVVLEGPIATQFFDLNGGVGMWVRVTPDGRLRFGTPVNPPDMPPPAARKIVVRNRTNATITASFGRQTFEIVGNTNWTHTDLPSGQTVLVTGNGATASYVYQGGEHEIRALSNGRYLGLPSGATVVKDTQPYLPDPNVDEPLPENPLPDDNDDDPDANDPGVSPLEGLPPNPLPNPAAAPLRDSVVSRFSRKTNQQTGELLTALDRGSLNRLTAISEDLADASLDAQWRLSMIRAARQGRTAEVEQLLAGLPNNPPGELLEPSSQLRVLVRLREQLNPLRVKAATGVASDELTPMLDALSRQANQAGDPGLTAAVTRIKRDLKIRDAVTEALDAANRQGAATALPKGEVTVIKHPWITAGNAYFTPSLLLVGNDAEQVLVAKADANLVLGMPVADNDTPAPAVEPTLNSDAVIVLNPVDNTANLSFRINNQDHSLAPGQQVELPSGPQYVIRFNRGGDRGEAKYNISRHSIYAFTLHDDAWDLRRRTIHVRLQNPSHGRPVQYWIDRELRTLPPGGVALQESTLPILVAFDRGEGVGVMQKKFGQGESAYFAIDPESGYWDLFLGDPPEPPAGPSDYVRIDRPTVREIRSLLSDTLFVFGPNDLFGEDSDSGEPGRPDDDDRDLLNELKDL